MLSTTKNCLFYHMTSNMTQRNELKLHQGKFRLKIRKNLFTESVEKHWNELSREMVESSSLHIFKKHRHDIYLLARENLLG